MRTDGRKPSWLSRVPALGTFIEIASDYVSEGSVDYFGKVPPIGLWTKSLGAPFAFAMTLALLTLPCAYFPFTVNPDTKAFDVAFAIVPSLLGFGIGAYALVFGLGGEIFRKIQEAHVVRAAQDEASTASVLNINSMFAFPLLVMTVTLVIATMQKILPGLMSLSTLTWFFTFASISLCYQLIKSLYRLGRVIILEKIAQH